MVDMGGRRAEEEGLEKVALKHFPVCEAKIRAKCYLNKWVLRD